MKNEIRRGWCLPLPVDSLSDIPDAILNPMGIASQTTVNEHNEIIPKDRLTHNLSHVWPSAQSSVNSRVDSEKLHPLIYGKMFQRLVHRIVAYRLQYPDLAIWLHKLDFKSAYRRMHVNGKTAASSATQVKFENTWLALLSLRLTFGGSPCPSLWSILSELCADLVNDILNCEAWDPSTVHSPLQHHIPPPPSFDYALPLAAALPLNVNIPLENNGKGDVFLDDIVSVAPDLPLVAPRLAAATLLALYVLAPEFSTTCPLPRDAMPSLSKLAAEGALSTRQSVLGWDVDTSALTVSLPVKKFMSWSQDIQSMLSLKCVPFKLLESTVGRLLHAALILPLARHFLSRIQRLLQHSSHFSQIFLPNHIKEDLTLWLLILRKVHAGVSMNLLTLRYPSQIVETDASQLGLGGVSSRGRVWRFEIPATLKGRAHINILEFLAVLIGLWLEIEEGALPSLSCILAKGDSTTAMGWIRRSGKYRAGFDDPSNTARLCIARKIAALVLNADICLYSQWILGSNNALADAASRRFDLSDVELLHLFSNISSSSQTAPTWHIKPLPTVITSFVFSVLQHLPAVKPTQHLSTPNASAPGDSGLPSSKTSASPPIPSLILSNNFIEYNSSARLPTPSIKPTSPQPQSPIFHLDTSTIPCHIFHRPSGLITNRIQDMTEMGNCTSCW